ncbi:MAG: hypothetical protein LR000_02530 [Candidatus Pacebacteria bacterium]|nr:hypothetical protein [Candidatus Paceibacterota bacterium]
MDLHLIKKLLEKEKAKIVIVENGKPIMVISPIESYLQEKNPKSESNPGVEQKELGFEREQSQKDTILLPEERKEESKGLTIDDLPL